MKTNILINAFGIQDSGGITVFSKMLEECSFHTKYKYYVFVYNNRNIINLMAKFESNDSFTFVMIKNSGIIHRLYYENIFFRSFIKKYNIALVYNFSGSNQFVVQVPTLVKVQNIMFYSKKLDEAYARSDNKKLWIKQVWSKRLIFLSMLKQCKNIEIQSIHVKDILLDFMTVKDKVFFLKNDFSAEPKDFDNPKQYDFSSKLTFLYIVGPHFAIPHKNMQDFVNAMMKLKKLNKEFRIKVTLDYEQLSDSALWDNALNEHTDFLGYLQDKDEIQKLFQDNTVLVSTSVIETIGLHIVEGVQNGIVCLAPDEPYAKAVYGDNLLKYKLFNSQSLTDEIGKIYDIPEKKIQDMIQKTQRYMIDNEASKFHNIVDIFNEILEKEEENV